MSVRHRRCSASGTKLKISSWEINRFTRRSASRKSFLRPRRPRLDKACARCRAPDMRPAPSRLSQLGFQYRSSAPHTGFQYCAVDSMTTSSTCCSISHSQTTCNCSGLLPYQRRSNWYSSSTSTSATTTASFFLWTSIPAILYGIGALLAGAESVLEVTLSRVSGYRRSRRGKATHHLFALSRTLRIRQPHGFGLSTVETISPLRAIVDYGPALRNFHAVSRASGPS